MEFDDIFKVGVAIILSGMGWFARQLWDAVSRLRDDIRRIEVDLPKFYVVKTDFTDAMREVRTGLERIYEKLDGKADRK